MSLCRRDVRFFLFYFIILSKMEKVKAFQVSGGWYKALMTMLVVVLVIQFINIIGSGCVNIYVDYCIQSPDHTLTDFLQVQSVSSFISTFVFTIVYSLLSVVYAKFALVSQQYSTSISVRFWLLMVLTVLGLLLTLCYPLTILYANAGKEVPLRVYDVLHTVGVTLFYITNLMILTIGIGQVVIGTSRLRLGGILVCAGAVCALLFYVWLSVAVGVLLPSDLRWIGFVLYMLGTLLAYTLIYVGWMRSIVKS